MGIGYARAEMATDFQAISADDLTFDLAASIAYRFSDTFTLGAGFIVTNLNGNDEILPGINFDWAPSEDFRAGIYGPNLLATYTFSENWNISLDGTPGAMYGRSLKLPRSPFKSLEVLPDSVTCAAYCAAVRPDPAGAIKLTSVTSIGVPDVNLPSAEN